jgi:polyhydroxyalkanoate synthase
MGSVFSMMTPMRTMLKYNFDLLEVVDDEQKLLNFLPLIQALAGDPARASCFNPG